MFNVQSLSIVVLRSTTSPSTSPAHAALPKPPAMSYFVFCIKKVPVYVSINRDVKYAVPP